MRSYLRPTYGFLLHLLVFIILPGDEMDNLQEIFVFIWQHQKRNQAKHPYRMKLDKLTMFQPKKGYPKLRGRASDIAGLAHCMFDLWSHYMDQGDQHHLRIRLFLKLNLELKDILETFSPTYGHTALPEPQYTKAFQGGLSMAQLHKQLNEHFEATDVIFFYCHKQNSFRMAQFAIFQLYTPFPDMVLRRRVHYASCTDPLEVLLAWQQTLVGFNESCLEGAPFNVDAVQRINLNSFTTGKAEITAFQVGFITCEKQRK